MKFGVREICEVVLRAKATQILGSRKFYKNEPVLYFDTLKTSSLEGAATTVYATGGRGNTRLVAWEGERTLTFTMEDALISPEGFAILSGAGLISATQGTPIYQHMTSQIEVKEKNTIELPEITCWNKYNSKDEYFHSSADIFVMTMTDGQIDAEPCIPMSIATDHKTLTCYGHGGTIDVGDVVLVDYYVKRTSGAQLIEITADKFGGNYYLEASTLFRDESSGMDMPAEFIIPNCKVQSNFTFQMASSGDPSTFTFTLDAFPDYTKFDRTRKVLAAIQIIEDRFEEQNEERTPCYPIDAKAITKDVDVTFDNDSTDGDTRITATGNGVNGVTYSTDNWGTSLPEDVYVAEMELNIPVENGKKYKLITRHPLLQYYKSDPNIEEESIGHYRKVQETTAAGDVWPMVIGLSNKPGAVTMNLYEVTGDGDKEVRKITINNEIEFAKKCKVIVDDEKDKISSKAVNEVTVTDFNKVVNGDTICLELKEAGTVKVNNKTISKGTDGLYTFTVNGNTNIVVS